MGPAVEMLSCARTPELACAADVLSVLVGILSIAGSTKRISSAPAGDGASRDKLAAAATQTAANQNPTPCRVMKEPCAPDYSNIGLLLQRADRPMRCFAALGRPDSREKPDRASRRRIVDILAHHIAIDANILHFPVKSRAAYAEFARHLRHLTAIMGEREANRLGLDVGKLAHLARLVDEAHNIGIARFEMRHFLLAVREIGRA